MSNVKVDSAQSAASYTFPNKDIPWLLKLWAEQTPDKAFLIWEPKDGNSREWSYQAFWQDANRVACGLIDKGVGKGDKVLIHAENCPEMVLAWYACAIIGAVGVTTNIRCIGEELAYFASHSDAVGCITQPQFYSELKTHAKTLQWFVLTDNNAGEPPTTDQLAHGQPLFESLMSKGDIAPERVAEPMLPIGIQYTSGTTSRPKAVVHTHANALWAGRTNCQNQLNGPDDVYLTFLPFFHVNAQSWCIWNMLWTGGTVVLQPKFSASRFWELSLKHKCTIASMIPFCFKAIGAQEVPKHHYRIWTTGIIMPQLEDWFKVRTFACWGMTETVAHGTRSDVYQSSPNMNIGLPTPGYEFAIIDAETGEQCPPEVNGEFCIRGTRGVQLFYEYYKNPEANEKSFTEDGWFKTGDMVRMGADGYFYFSDRDKDLLKVGAENVSARQVEEVIYELQGCFDEVAVVAQKHDMLDEVPVVFAIKSPYSQETEEQLREKLLAHCESKLADFKCPKAVYFMEEFPRVTLEKTAKNKLRDLANQYAEEQSS